LLFFNQTGDTCYRWTCASGVISCALVIRTRSTLNSSSIHFSHQDSLLYI
jgi:hypothetical protein